MRNNLVTTNGVILFDYKFTRNSIIIILFIEKGPQFHIVHVIIINKDTKFQIVGKHLYDTMNIIMVMRYII